MRLITGTKDKGLGSEGCQLSSVESIKIPQKKEKKNALKLFVLLLYIYRILSYIPSYRLINHTDKSFLRFVSNCVESLMIMKT